MEVGLTVGHDVHDQQADPLLKITRALRGEGALGLRAILVSRADQFQGTDQRRPAGGLKDLDFDLIRENGGHAERGRRRSPGGDGNASLLGFRRPLAPGKMERGKIDFDATADMDLGLGEISFGEGHAIEPLDDRPAQRAWNDSQFRDGARGGRKWSSKGIA